MAQGAALIRPCMLSQCAGFQRPMAARISVHPTTLSRGVLHASLHSNDDALAQLSQKDRLEDEARETDAQHLTGRAKQVGDCDVVTMRAE